MNGIEVLEELNSKWQQEYPGLAELQLCDWVPWSQRKSLLGIGRKGVYIMAKHSPGVVPSLVDPLGEAIICIGKTIGRTYESTKSFRDRLGEFHRAAFGGGANHAEGETYRKEYGPNPGGLYVSICPVYWENRPENILLKELDPDADAFQQFRRLHRYITFLEVCLRGTYVYVWGRLPNLNKE